MSFRELIHRRILDGISTREVTLLVAKNDVVKGISAIRLVRFLCVTAPQPALRASEAACGLQLLLDQCCYVFTAARKRRHCTMLCRKAVVGVAPRKEKQDETVQLHES